MTMPTMHQEVAITTIKSDICPFPTTSKMKMEHLPRQPILFSSTFDIVNVIVYSCDFSGVWGNCNPDALHIKVYIICTV